MFSSLSHSTQSHKNTKTEKKNPSLSTNEPHSRGNHVLLKSCDLIKTSENLYSPRNRKANLKIHMEMQKTQERKHNFERRGPTWEDFRRLDLKTFYKDAGTGTKVGAERTDTQTHGTELRVEKSPGPRAASWFSTRVPGRQ